MKPICTPRALPADLCLHLSSKASLFVLFCFVLCQLRILNSSLAHAVAVGVVSLFASKLSKSTKTAEKENWLYREHIKYIS